MKKIVLVYPHHKVEEEIIDKDYNLLMNHWKNPLIRNATIQLTTTDGNQYDIDWNKLEYILTLKN